MSKWYWVDVQSTQRFLVEIDPTVDDYEDPVQAVLDNACISEDWDEINQGEIHEEQLDSYIRHCDKDKVLSL